MSELDWSIQGERDLDRQRDFTRPGRRLRAGDAAQVAFRLLRIDLLQPSRVQRHLSLPGTHRGAGDRDRKIVARSLARARRGAVDRPLPHAHQGTGGARLYLHGDRHRDRPGCQPGGDDDRGHADHPVVDGRGEAASPKRLAKPLPLHHQRGRGTRDRRAELE